MRVRYTIGVFTASIIFGGLAYASYDMDSAAIINQKPLWIQDPQISTMHLAMAEQAEEFPESKVASLQKSKTQLAALQLFSSQSQQTQNNAQNSSNNTNGNQSTKKAASVDITDDVITNNTAAENASDNATNRVISKNRLPQQQANETNIPSNSVNVPVTLPDNPNVTTKVNVQHTVTRTEQPIITRQATAPQVYQTSNHTSFHTVPTPVYFAPGSAYHASAVDASADASTEANTDNTQTQAQAVQQQLDAMNEQASQNNN